MENKKKALEQIAKEIEDCKICKIGTIGKAVPGEGNPDARVVFIGEAPGKKEAENGRPFIGISGQLLRSLIKSIGLTEEDVYITSPVKYLPISGTPTAKDIVHGKVHFDKQIASINPTIVVLLGAVAAKAALGEVLPVKKMHGHVIEKNNRKYFLTFHPAAGLRFPPLRKILGEDFAKLKKLISSR